MADILEEGALGTAAAARWLNQHVDGGKFRPISVWRYMSKGCVAVDGQRIFLEHAKLGKKFVTSGPALSRFATRLAQNKVTVAARNTGSIEGARSELEDAGFFR